MPLDNSSQAIKAKRETLSCGSEEIKVLYTERINMMSMFSQMCIFLQWKAISATNLAMQSNLVL
jgi:hypothetical protein